MRIRIFSTVLLLAVAAPGIGTAARYTPSTRAECVVPIADAARCDRSAWARPDGKFGGQVDLSSTSPAGGWTYGTATIELTRRLEYTSGISTLDYSLHVVAARAMVERASNALTTMQADIIHTVTFEHECKCVEPTTVDYMGPFISSDGRFVNAMYGASPRYRTTAFSNWPSGIVRVTLRFDLAAQLGDTYHVYPAGSPVMAPTVPAAGRVLVFIKGYVTDMKFTRMQNGG